MLSYKHNNFLGRPLNLFLSLLQSISGGLLDIYGPKLFVDNWDVRHTNRTFYYMVHIKKNPLQKHSIKLYVLVPISKEGGLT